MATKKEKDFLHELDKRLAVLEDTIDRLETNHLSHLQKQIDKIDARIWAIILGAVLQLVGIVSIFIGMSN
jgi:chaperonin cofactor prefoldin